MRGRACRPAADAFRDPFHRPSIAAGNPVWRSPRCALPQGPGLSRNSLDLQGPRTYPVRVGGSSEHARLIQSLGLVRKACASWSRREPARGLIVAARGQQSVEDFYHGKQLDMVIGYSPGGTYDLYARWSRAFSAITFRASRPSCRATCRARAAARRCDGSIASLPRTEPCSRPPTSRCRSSRPWATSSSASTPPS